MLYYNWKKIKKLREHNATHNNLFYLSHPFYANQMVFQFYKNQKLTSFSSKIPYNCKDVSTAVYGEYWRQIRSISVLHLLSAKRVQSLRAVREEEVGFMVEKIKQCCSGSVPVNISELVSTTINDIVCRVALGRKYSGESGKGFKKLLMEFTELLGTIIVGDYVPWLDWLTHVSGFYARAKRVAKEFDDLLEDVVEDHIRKQKEDSDFSSAEDHGDFVDVLRWIQRTESLGFPIDRTVIKALLLVSI